MLKGAVEFLVSADAQAVMVRDWFDIFVYPLVASAGRAGGATRTDFEDLAKSTDVNRAWTSSALETITKHKAAILADAGATVAVLFDFHGHMTSSNLDYDDNPATLSKWATAVQTYIPGLSTIGWDEPTSSTGWALTSKATEYPIVSEHTYVITLDPVSYTHLILILALGTG